MAEKRMFAKKITESDAFLDMPSSTQALYFHLNMSADDDGFVNNPKKIQRMVGASDDDMKILMVKSFVILFESGIIVIKHWKMHNYIQNDRYKPTDYIEEKSMLQIKKNKAYTLDVSNLDTNCIQDVSVDKNRLDKSSEDKNSTDKERKDIPDGNPSSRVQNHKYGEYQRVLLTDSELDRLNREFGEAETQAAIKFLDEYIEEKGYKSKSHNLALRRWVFDAVKRDKAKRKQTPTDFYNEMEEWVNERSGVCDNINGN
jgi:hypothetical protein